MTSVFDTANQGTREQQIADFWHRQPLLFLAIASASGILLDSILTQSYFVRSLLWSVIAVHAIFVYAFVSRRLRRVVLGLLFSCLAGLLHAYHEDRFESAALYRLLGEQPEPAIVEGTIDRPVVLRQHPLAGQSRRENESPWQSVIELSVSRIGNGQAFQDCTGRLLVVADGKQDHFLPGDSIRAYGWTQLISGPTNPGERDLRPVYRRRGIHARMDVSEGDQLQSLGQQFAFLRPIAVLATRSRDLLLQNTSSSVGPLAVALVIGQRDFVDYETRDRLLVTGTAHLLSVSGLHLAIVVVLAGWTATLLRMPMGYRIVWILAVCCLYTAITGGRPPVVRAAVLVGMLMLSIWVKRPAQPINTLALAALILMYLNPGNVFHVGVQLSFLAVSTLFLCGSRSLVLSPSAQSAVENEQRLDELLDASRSRIVRFCRWVMLVLGRTAWYSACVSSISLPLVWHQFHVVSIISVLTNVVMGPFLFVSLASGVLTVIGGWCFEPLAVIPGAICGASLMAMRGIINFAASVPLGHFWLPSPPGWWVFTFYLVMAASLYAEPSKRVSRWRYAGVLLWIVAAWWMATTRPALEKGACEAIFVDVGHGTSVVLRESDGAVWLYDCGRLANETGSSYGIDTALWSVGATRLKGIFLSHADSDHYNAIPGLLRRFRAEQIITAPGMLDLPKSGLIAARDAIGRSGVPVHEVYAGATFPNMPESFSILHPPASGVAGSDNANSLVLQIDVAGKSLLLPGDLEPPGTEVFIENQRPPAGGVLMAPHHGSLTMDAEAVLQWARPREVIVSGGKRARKPEVREMLRITGAGVHVTSEVGAIRVRILPSGKIEIRSWNESPW